MGQRLPDSNATPVRQSIHAIALYLYQYTLALLPAGELHYQQFIGAGKEL